MILGAGVGWREEFDPLGSVGTVPGMLEVLERAMTDVAPKSRG